MTMRTNPELMTLLQAEPSKYLQVRALNTALTSTKRIKARRVADAATSQDAVWASGTLFRDAALIGSLTYNGSEITGWGVTSDLVTCLAADLTTGKSVLRIEGNGHWVEGTVGLTGSGADFILSDAPTTSNSIAIASTMRIWASSSLPDGTPDTTAPTITIAADVSTVSTNNSPVAITATVSDNVGVASVTLRRDGEIVGTKNSAPWTFTDTLTWEFNGNVAYVATASDVAGNVGTSNTVNVTVNIPYPVETGPAVAVGSEITTVSLQSTASTTATNVPFTFGQAFKVGALPASGAAVELRAPDNSIVAAQLDVKNLHPDGSVKFGIISTIVPSLTANQTIAYSIRRKTAVAATALLPSNFTGLTASATIVDTGTDLAGPTAGVSYTADATAALAGGQYVTWLSGPICSEWIVRGILKDASNNEHPDLHVRFHIRAYQGQKAKIDFVVENTWAKPKNPQPTTSGTVVWDDVSINDRIYRPTLKVGSGGTTVYTHNVKGYARVRLERNTNGYFTSTPTNITNDSTAYTCSIDCNGTVRNISILGSQMQTYGQLLSQLNTQLQGLATAIYDEYLTLRITGLEAGPASYVKITNYGTLFPLLQHEAPTRPIYGGEVIHYPRTRWKKTYWWTTGGAMAEPATNIVINRTYLEDSKLVPKYQADLVGDTTTIDANYSTVTGNEEIGRNGMSKQFFGDTGYAPGIGIHPEWAALWLVSQQPKAFYVLKKMADLSGSWPMFLREYDTDTGISTDKWPHAAITGTSGDNKNPTTNLSEGLPAPVRSPNIIINTLLPDLAHHPDFNTMAYIATGDYCYMEGMLMQQRYMVLNTSSAITTTAGSFRQGRKCLFKETQVRICAWSLRSTAQTLSMLPTGHSLISSLQYQMDSNIEWYTENYVKTSGKYHNALGIIIGPGALAYSKNGGIANGIAPWQDDFFTSAVGRSIELGYVGWTGMLRFKIKSLTGRLTSGPSFCWQVGSNYDFQVCDNTGTPLYTSWGQVYTAQFPQLLSLTCGTQEMATAISQYYSSTMPATINAMANYPTYIYGNPSIMESALSYGATANLPNADNAWLVLKARSVQPDYNKGPQFAIVPRN